MYCGPRKDSWQSIGMFTLLLGRVVLRFGNGLIGVNDAEGLRSGVDALCALGSQWYTCASCLLFILQIVQIFRALDCATNG
ncbi:hypothetical protein T4D_14668 [Trichinella pseudospiralis]|uniref:Uncharacterized protein n=1 Tax=Trichinella pseudospiralis TaxID=6337 RepID=A0A0V1FBA6_TRIPS|nr:hypothetical protein T4D_14668 [Trichinella pseudospiralis]